MTERSAESTRVAALRSAFDGTFVEPQTSVEDGVVDLLGLRAAGHRYAVRLSEVAGLLADRRIAPLPSSVAELLGLTGVRGVLVPVYDLGAVLGHSPSTDSLRWLLLIGSEHPVGLAFSTFDGPLQLPHSELSKISEGTSRLHCREVAGFGTEARAIIGIESVMTTIARKATGLRVTKER